MVKAYATGKPLSISDLKQAPLKRNLSPRDQGIQMAINAALQSPPETVLPMYLNDTDKPATVKLAAKKMIERMGLDGQVYVGINSAFDERAILFSRSVLSERGRRSK